MSPKDHVIIMLQALSELKQLKYGMSNREYCERYGNLLRELERTVIDSMGEV